MRSRVTVTHERHKLNKWVRLPPPLLKGDIMNVLVACEFSGIVRNAFNNLGHNAWSCDLLDSELEGNHYRGDIKDFLKFKSDWDLVIAHPPCTDLAVSGARYFKEKQEDGRQQKAIEFFMFLATLAYEKICIENPVSIMSTVWKKPDQIIQPWQFGHPESKATCLWLKNLPLLIPTNILNKPKNGYWENQTPSGQNKLPPSKDRAKIRARTYTNIAKAMAEQWTRN